MNSLFTLFKSIAAGDMSVLELSQEEIQTVFTEHIQRIVSHIRNKEGEYLSEFWLNKQVIVCVFQENPACQCSQYEIVLLRLAIIDNLYSTQMRMNPYGLGELAEAISLMGTDQAFRNKIVSYLSSKDASVFDYLKSQMHYYKDGKRSKAANLLEDGFGVADKRAISLISKYACFLTGGQFPIVDSLVRSTYPLLWERLCPSVPVPPIGGELPDYIGALDQLCASLGNISYYELDFVLWHVGKIIGGNLSQVLSMEDYMKMPADFDIRTFNISNYSCIACNPLLEDMFTLAKMLAPLK